MVASRPTPSISLHNIQGSGKEGGRTQLLGPIPLPHLHLLIPKEEEKEEAGPSLQGQPRPPGLHLPVSSMQGVADDVGSGGMEARVEVDSDVWPWVQTAAALEVYLKPAASSQSPQGLLR